MQKLSFLRQHRSIVTLWSLCCAFSGVLLWGGIFPKLQSDKEAVIKEVLKKESSILGMYSQQFAYSHDPIHIGDVPVVSVGPGCPSSWGDDRDLGLLLTVGNGGVTHFNEHSLSPPIIGKDQGADRVPGDAFVHHRTTEGDYRYIAVEGTLFLLLLGTLCVLFSARLAWRKHRQEALSRLANADPVTSLHNRHWLMDYLRIPVERARSGDTVLALLFVDLDDFKNINDIFGYAVGDEMLRLVALRLKSAVRSRDHVMRLGGDEFAVILERVESDTDVSGVAERLARSLREPFGLPDATEHLMHASIGISLFPRDGDDGGALLKNAEIAMYAAKANGKRNYRFYQPLLLDRLKARVTLEQSLRQAIVRDEFVLYYQPRVSTVCGELRSLEALVRWIHPELGLVAPDDFIPIAEETGLIVQLGELIVKKSCEQIAQWKSQHLPVVPVSVNVSPRQFSQGNLSTIFSFCIAHYGIDPSLLEVEITESCVIEEAPTVTAELAAIEALGVKLLVDDFGTGYSSLSQLRRPGLDVLKVDRTFTARLGNGKEGNALFMAILSIAHVLDLRVVAEGVETVEQLRILQSLPCDEIQGYLISRPVPAVEVPPLMLKRLLLP